MIALLLALASIFWWVAYARSGGSIWYLVAALLCTLAWLLTTLRSGNRQADAITEQALGPKRPTRKDPGE